MSLKSEDLELVNALDFKQSLDLLAAVDAAMDAMASFGSEQKHMEVMAMFRVVALREKQTAFVKHERELERKGVKNV